MEELGLGRAPSEGKAFPGFEKQHRLVRIFSEMEEQLSTRLKLV